MVLVKITGDPHIMDNMSRTASLELDPVKPLGDTKQMQQLNALLGHSRYKGPSLAPGFTLYRGETKERPGRLLQLHKSAVVNGLRANDYLYVKYDPPDEASDEMSQVGASGPNRGYNEVPEPNAFADLPIPPHVAHPGDHSQQASSRQNNNSADVRLLAEELERRQQQIEALGERIREADNWNSDLRRQVVLLTEELQARQSFAPSQHRSPSSSPAPSPARTRGATPNADEGSLRRKNRSLEDSLADALDELRITKLKLETIEAWKAQHDCTETGKKPSTLREDIVSMKNTLRDVFQDREYVKEGLAARKRELGDRFKSQASASQGMVQKAAHTIGSNGTQLMPSPYYMDPYTAPASVYQPAGGYSEGTVCKLKVQTLTGEGTVVRRVYSALTRNNQHVMILASLEGVVTDEIVTTELLKAGVGFERPDLLYLATDRHRWVLCMEPEERAKWLDWLVFNNPALSQQ
eukprot:gene11547-17783_t